MDHIHCSGASLIQASNSLCIFAVIHLMSSAWLAVGVTLFVVGAVWLLALTRTMTTMLEGVKPTDPLTFAAVVAVTAVVAVGASLIPARRAAKTDLAKVMTG